MTNHILVVAAHPHDEVLGCGGTIAKHSRNGDKITILILGEGITSRDDIRDVDKRASELSALQANIQKAGEILGVTDILTFNFPDNRFDTVALLDIIKCIEQIIKECKPNAVYTHHHGDLNIDHRITFDAVLTACRPVENNTVKEIYSFEVPSSTEWNAPTAKNYFRPNVFVDISDTIELKTKAMEAYASEKRTFPHPRSSEALRIIAKRWGINAGLTYAEPFWMIRSIKS